MKILGLHHITIGASDAQKTVDFYSGVLGLRFTKRTVNFDAPDTYHLYFGDETGRPGTAITFFEWPGVAKGRRGIGGTDHLALTVRDGVALRKWKRYLSDRSIQVRGPFNRAYFESIYFEDPDGLILELATHGPGFTIDEPSDALGKTFIEPTAAYMRGTRDEAAIAADTWPTPIDIISADMVLYDGMHHITAISSKLERTAHFYEDVLGMARVKMTADYEGTGNPHWYWGVDGGQPGTLISYFGAPVGKTRMAAHGVGQTHHFALAVADEDEQMRWRERLVQHGFNTSTQQDRMYFRSIYTRDPDGHVVEIATNGPGFMADEPMATLGERLMLPPWYEHNRAEIERTLKPITVPAWRKISE
jgi:glyoxalase family protein